MAKRKAKETKTKAAPAKRTRVKAAPVVITPAVRNPGLEQLAAAIQREMRNGVKRPKEGGACAAVWEALDQLRAAGTVPATKDVRDLATAKGWNENNATAELSAWRKFMGLSKPPQKRSPRRRSAAKLAGLPRMSAEEVIPYTA